MERQTFFLIAALIVLPFAIFAVRSKLPEPTHATRPSVATAEPTVEKASITGTARVVDGDTLQIRDTTIRLHGIDAPERHQVCERAGQQWACGEAAASALKALTAGREITCNPMGQDRYQRTIAVCRSPEGLDINEALVRSGVAVAYRRYSSDYITIEEEARRNRQGLWGSKFELPWDYRAAQRTH